MPVPSSPRLRPARVRRLFTRFDLEFRKLCAAVNRAADEVAREVVDLHRGPLPLAVIEARSRFNLDEPLSCFAPEGLERTRAVEAIVLAGRPRDAAKVAVGVIRYEYRPELPGGSVFLVEGDFVEPLPAHSRIELGPL